MTDAALADVFPRHRTIQIGRIETRVHEAGDGPDLVLLHGNPDTHTVWSGVVSRLAARHRCIAPDLPGFGETRAPRDLDCALEAQAAWTRGVLDGLALDRVHLAVHDVGGSYGLAFAALDPERLLSLTIFNSSFFPDYRWHFWAKVWRTRGLGEIAMAIVNRPLFVRELVRGSPRMPRAYARHAYTDFTRDTRRLVLRWYRAMNASVYVGWDTRLLAATAATPKQVLWGDRDPFIPAATADRFGGEVHRFADCGHHVMVERPDEAAGLIEALVARSGTAPR